MAIFRFVERLHFLILAIWAILIKAFYGMQMDGIFVAYIWPIKFKKAS